MLRLLRPACSPPYSSQLVANAHIALISTCETIGAAWGVDDKVLAGPHYPLIIIRMHPLVGRDRALHGELDHMHAWRITRRPARAAFQRRLNFPDRRIARPADVFERDAGLGFTAMAFDV